MTPFSILGLVYAREWEKRDKKVVEGWAKRKYSLVRIGELKQLPDFSMQEKSNDGFKNIK